MVRTLTEGGGCWADFTEKDFKGDYVEFPLHVRRNPAHGGNTAGGAYRDSGHQAHLKGTIYRTFYDNAISLDDAIQAAAQGEGAVRDAVDQEVSGVAEDAAFWLGSICYGDGSGQVGEVAAVVSGAKVVTVEQSGGALFLPQLVTWEGAKFDFYNSTGATYKATSTLKALGTATSAGQSVGAVTSGDIVLQFEDDLTLADGDLIFWKGTTGETKGLAPNGFNSLVDDIDATFQNIDIGEFPRYSSFVDANGGTLREPDIAMIRRAMANMRNKTGVAPGNYVIKMNPSTFAALDKIDEDDVRYFVNDSTVGRAVNQVQTNQGSAIFEMDNACPDNQAFGLDKSQLVRYVVKQLGFVRRGGDILFESLSAKQVIAQMTAQWENAIMDRRTSFRIDDLSSVNFRKVSFA